MKPEESLVVNGKRATDKEFDAVPDKRHININIVVRDIPEVSNG